MEVGCEDRGWGWESPRRCFPHSQEQWPAAAVVPSEISQCLDGGGGACPPKDRLTNFWNLWMWLYLEIESLQMWSGWHDVTNQAGTKPSRLVSLQEGEAQTRKGMWRWGDWGDVSTSPARSLEDRGRWPGAKRSAQGSFPPAPLRGARLYPCLTTGLEP